MSRISLLVLFAALVSFAHGADVVVNALPGDARFVNYGAIDWKGITIAPETLQEFAATALKATQQASTIASGAGADLVVLIAPDSGVAVAKTDAGQEIRLRQKDPVLVAVFYKMKQGRRASQQESAIQFTTSVLPKTDAESVDFKITRVADTAGVTMSYWVYMNLPRFVAEAAAKHFDTITFKSSEDAVCEDVWLPGCDVPLRISRKKPEIECSIYKRAANQPPQPRR